MSDQTSVIVDYRCVLHDTPTTRRDMASAYEMHRTLERVTAHTGGRMLWRLDRLVPAGNVVTVRGSAVLEEALAAAVRSGLYTDDATLIFSMIARTEFTPPAAGTYRQFQLRANPTVARQGKRYNIVGEGHLLHWLQRQGEQGGFIVHDAFVDRGLSHMGKNPKGIALVAHNFSGVLEVVDADRFGRTLTAGIGRGKGFGLGLLVLE